MHEPSYAFLKKLLETPSPSGYERPVQDVVRQWAQPYAKEVHTDRHGNVIAVINPGGQPRIMLAGHCDQIGLMVQHIDENGYLYVQPIGAWDMQILLGQALTVWTIQGPVPGVVSRKAPHLQTFDERGKVPQFQEIWVDIGARDCKDVEGLVRAGDPVTLELGVRVLRNELISSPALDDKVGVWTVMEALRLIEGCQLKAAVYCVSTVQEEIGMRGATTSAHGIHPAIGIVVDVCHATDTPGGEKNQLGDTRLGAGPVLFRGPNINPRVLERLQDSAKSREINVQVRGAPQATWTDANAIQLSREGVATALIGIPNRYMHSPVEVVHLDDLDRAARLIADFCVNVTPEADWTP